MINLIVIVTAILLLVYHKKIIDGFPKLICWFKKNWQEIRYYTFSDDSPFRSKPEKEYVPAHWKTPKRKTIVTNNVFTEGPERPKPPKTRDASFTPPQGKAFYSRNIVSSADLMDIAILDPSIEGNLTTHDCYKIFDLMKLWYDDKPSYEKYRYLIHHVLKSKESL